MCILNKISDLLKEKGKTQKDLTDYLGLTKNTFTNWKGGNNTSYKKYLPEIAEFLGVSVDYLLGKSDTIIKQSVFSFEGEGSSEQTLNIEELNKLSKLLDAARGLPAEQIEALINVANSMKFNNE